MKMWEIWKSAKMNTEGRKLLPADYVGCIRLHKRYKTKAEATRVAADMKRQGRVCCVRKRKVTEECR